MKNIYLYNPDVCDVEYCCKDCDKCPKRHILEEMNEEGENA